jgi:hypothetical protein
LGRLSLSAFEALIGSDVVAIAVVGKSLGRNIAAQWVIRWARHTAFAAGVMSWGGGRGYPGTAESEGTVLIG